MRGGWLKSTWIPIWHPMDHVFMVTWILFKPHLLEGRPNTKPRDPGTLNVHNYWFILLFLIMCEDSLNRNSLK